MPEQRQKPRQPVVAVSALIALALAMAAGASPAAAQGWLEPRPGMPAGSWQVVKLRGEVNVRVDGRVAHVEIEEWFRNDGPRFGEADYIHPLPGGAVFESYSLYQGDTELRGETLDAADARRVYEQIVRSRRDPALIEMLGNGMLRARVFPFERGEVRRITMRYTQLLEQSGDALHFRYVASRPAARAVAFLDARPVERAPAPPPRPPIVSPREMALPGAAVPMPQHRPAPLPGSGMRMVPAQPQPQPIAGVSAPAHVLTPVRETIDGAGDSVPFRMRLTVENGARYRDAWSPTHDVAVRREGGRMIVEPSGSVTGAFSVVMPLAQRGVGISLLAHRPALGEDGYFMLTLTPGEVDAARMPRDVTVVVDVSGSMSGEKMEQARRALVQLLGTLDAHDRFRLISFSSRVTAYRADWTAASRAERMEAGRWIEALQASGGTNISGALEEAFAVEPGEGRLPFVVFLTDGMPTVGETNAARISERAAAMRGDARLFAFGVGYDVNTMLLDGLSAAARGTTQYVLPEDDVEVAVATLAAKIAHPVLADLAIDGTPVRLREIYPTQLPDLFAGEDLVIFGRYEAARRNASGDIAIAGRRGTGGGSARERFTARVTFPVHSPANDFVPRLWASRKIGELARHIRTNGADAELVDELRATALRYGLLSEYTSYLVLEPGATVRPGHGALSLDEVVVTGSAAVASADASRQAREARTVAQLGTAQAAAAKAAAPSPAARGGSAAGVGGANSAHTIVAGRYFAQQDGVWRDAGITASARVLAIEPLSDAWFRLIEALPELREVLAYFDDVEVAGRDITIRIAPGGARTIPPAQLEETRRAFRALERNAL